MIHWRLMLIGVICGYVAARVSLLCLLFLIIGTLLGGLDARYGGQRRG